MKKVVGWSIENLLGKIFCDKFVFVFFFNLSFVNVVLIFFYFFVKETKVGCFDQIIFQICFGCDGVWVDGASILEKLKKKKICCRTTLN